MTLNWICIANSSNLTWQLNPFQDEQKNFLSKMLILQSRSGMQWNINSKSQVFLCWAKELLCENNMKHSKACQVTSYLLQMTEGLIIGSDKLGALWVEVKTLCGFKPCLVAVSVESGNDTEDIFLVGLAAGVPWIGEWHGEARGEIFGGTPGRRKEESHQLTEVTDGCTS